MPEIEIKDANGNLIGIIDATAFPLYVTTDTVSATRKYTLTVNYVKDENGNKDLSKIKGMQLG